MGKKIIEEILLVIFSFSSLINCELSIIGPYKLSAEFNDKPIDIAFGKVTEQTQFYIHGELFFERMTNTHQACEPLSEFPSYKETNEFTEKYGILLAYKGGCSIVQKARNAQIAGASMIILINDDERNIKDVLLEDDGSGRDIHIPIGLISQNDGRKIEMYMEAHQSERVMIEINFNQIETKEIVDFKLFFSSSEIKAYELIETMAKYLNKFGGRVKFTPIYVSHQSPYYNPENPQRESNCISRGKYCYFPKSSTIIQDGEKILLESLRQKCMFQQSKEDSNNYYYEYIKKFKKICLTGRTPNFNERCSKLALEEMGLPIDFLDNCLAQSFGVSNLMSSSYTDNENEIYKNEYKEIIKYGLTTFPSAVIDEKPLVGLVKENNIIISICNKITEKPDFCSLITGSSAESSSKKKKWVFFLILLLLLVNFGIFYLCHRYIKKRVKEKIDFSTIDIDGRINNVINNYLSLKSNQEMDYKAFNTDLSKNKQSSKPIEGSVSTV